jgi:hypothetical protein
MSIGGTKALLTEHPFSVGHGERDTRGFILGPPTYRKSVPNGMEALMS